jgi:hypothetical protein
MGKIFARSDSIYGNNWLSRAKTRPAANQSICSADAGPASGYRTHIVTAVAHFESPNGVNEMAWDPELEYDFSGLPLSKTLGGSAVAYFVWPSGGVEYEIMDFTISDGGDPSDPDLRGTRQQMRKKGKKLPPLSSGTLKRISLVLLFGPETNPKQAIRSLRKAADLIEKRGLVTGRRRGAYQKEYVRARERG